ncbi:MAG: ATP-binding protein, partial [Gemmatimonadales bacterium]
AEHGAVGGVLVTVAETTQRVLGERRLRTLRELGSQGSEARTTTDACVLAAATLARNPLDVPFALVYLLDDSGTRASLAAAVGLAAGTPASPEQIDLGSPDMPWPLEAVGSSRVSVVVDTRSGVVDRLPGGPWPDPVRQALVAPVAASAQQPLAGFLVAGASPRLALDTEYRGFLELVGSHVATAVYNARAYEEERRRPEALVELDRAKTTFFSNVSHEFRTPLTLLLGPIEDALTNAAEPLPPAQRERLDLAHRNGLRLLKLVNTLLDFSRIEAGRVEAIYEPTDLAAVTADLASTFRSAIERAGLRLVVDAPPLPVSVYVDRDMWEKIVLNLLSNAFKFTFEGSITVALRGASDHVEVEVSDTGTGIPPGELPHLFERFHRIKGALGRTQEGTGIGLALVQELVRQHGGRVEVASELGRGTSFTIHLPTGTAHLPPDKVSGATRALSSTALGAAPFIQEASRWLPDAAALAADGGVARAAPAADLGNSSPRALGGFAIRGRDGGVPRVLLADDNADMREYVARLLGNQWRVHAVADGQAALEAVLEDPPDLVLADVMMPRLDGFGLLRALRADPRTRALPILLLSARAGEEASAEGLEAGADDYLTKPFTGRELLARVGAHLAMAALRRETLDRERDQLERVFELSPTFLAVLRGPDHIFDLVNPAYYQLAGHRDLIGKPVRAALPEIEGQRFLELLDEVHRTGQPFVGKELPVQLQRAPEAPLERRYVDFVYQPMQDPAGEVIGILVSGADVTDLVAAREEAQQLAGERDAERRRLLTVLEQSPLAIAIAEAPSGRLLFTNAKTGELLGGAAPMTAGGTYADLGPVSRDGEVIAPADHPLARALLRGQTVTSEVVEVEHSDGRRHELVANAAPVRDAEGRIIAAVVIFWDVTEERQTERQLRDAQRLQAVGTLAGGVAHEVNNQMTAVLGFGTFALRAIGPDHPQAEDLRRVLQAGERAAHITQQLLAFSRRQVTRPQVVDLQALAAELRPVLEHLLGSDKTLVIASRRAAGRVRVDPAQVEQVLINLVANARDATNTGGRVTIEVEDVEVVRDDPRAEHPRTIALGSYILLRVSDTGHGMTPETA